MAVPKLLTLSVVFSLVLAGVRADVEAEEAIERSEVSDSALNLEIEQLKSKISALESGISDRSKELKVKDGRVMEMEMIIQEKSASVSSLQREVELLQRKGSEDAEELVGKALSRANELENQVAELKNEIKLQSGGRDTLEARASQSETQMQELKLKLENIEKKSNEQKRTIQKLEHALQAAEEELVRAQLEATSKSKDLTEIHGSWLPPWLANHICHCQELAASYWSEHGKPALDVFLLKASEKSLQVQKLVEPHLDRVKTKWIPTAKAQWMTFTTYAGPYVEKLSAKTIETYEICKSTITPHIVKVQTVADPYFQEAKKFAKPHINQIATITKPHVEKVRVILKPYTKQVVYAYAEFLKSATTYHHQVQATVHEKLKKHEVTKALATKELVWFMASALLALPILFLYRILSAIFCKKVKKPTQNGDANHVPRRPKRRHADK